MSNTFNTNLIWYNKNFYKLGPNEDFYEYGLCHPEYRRPHKWPNKVNIKYKRAMIKNYWNSKKYKKQSHPNVRKDIASLRWYWD